MFWTIIIVALLQVWLINKGTKFISKEMAETNRWLAGLERRIDEIYQIEKKRND